jgi:hypothetical protein
MDFHVQKTTFFCDFIVIFANFSYLFLKFILCLYVILKFHVNLHRILLKLLQYGKDETHRNA